MKNKQIEVFSTKEQALRAIHDWKQKGYTDDNVCIFDKDEVEHRLLQEGMSVNEVQEYKKSADNGEILILVDTKDNRTTAVDHDSDTIRLHEEQLDINKRRVQAGEVQLHKEVVEEEKVVNVPVEHDEIYIKRHPVHDVAASAEAFQDDEIIRVPVTKEQIEVTKKPVVTSEIVIGKQKVQETAEVRDTLKKEEVHLNKSKDLEVREE
ncbi:YsnF/AvaK domain-containing protein [Aneurinibacillus tyrosinisolvens]|uniref:YsnF/AvaK domain-containing protein n=1 Tax=Aneurinibacillus tyrosinisolvens TaxID=1443435 RepID=UPI00069BCF64|nr:YsnF/AvaK domain-containing protein [Aneurinibacillus tyrosinisolvens]